jgi:hypothetical protein
LLSTDVWLQDTTPGTPIDQEESSFRRALVATASGSARTVRIGELGPIVRSGDGTDASLGGHVTGWLPSAAHTQHGVNGRDLPN